MALTGVKKLLAAKGLRHIILRDCDIQVTFKQVLDTLTATIKSIFSVSFSENEVLSRFPGLSYNFCKNT